MSFHKEPVNQSTPSRHHLNSTVQNQMQFNLNASNKDAGLTQTHKPKAIIIEKLLPYPKPEERIQRGKDDLCSLFIAAIPETVLSSEKLAFAVQLAKMDIQKLKTMLHDNGDAAADHSIYPPKVVIRKKTNAEPDKTKKKKTSDSKQKRDVATSTPQRHINQPYPDTKLSAIKDEAPTKTTVQANKKSKPTKPAPPQAPVQKQQPEPINQKENEMKRLRKDLLKYSQALDIVVSKLNQEKFIDVSHNDEQMRERERNLVRAEEQRNRSARMLYMLQRKVEDLRNELSSNKNNIRQTKKSQFTTKLASAHRAAVKALQTFVSHAPLYYNTAGKFPPMYKALALLIQQLTSLSTDNLLEPDTDTMEIIEDLIESLSQPNEKQQPSLQQVDVPRKKKPAESKETADMKKQYLDKRIDWLKKKADELNIKSFHDEATPDRASSLKHAIQSLEDEEFSVEKKKSPLPKPVLKVKTKKPKSSVLLPNNLKKRKMKIPTRPYHPQPSGNMNYAAATVISKIREKPPIEKKPKTPPTSPRKVVFNDEEPSTPKKRDPIIIEEGRAVISGSPSPHRRLDMSVNAYLNNTDHTEVEGVQPIRMTPTKVQNMEREIDREKWLQKRKAKEISRLDAIEKMNTNWLGRLSKEIKNSDELVKHVEEQIKNRLQPLLQKAEEISQDEARREESYQSSLNRRLAGIASQKAMSEGERLAEYILDDLIKEAALDLKSMEEYEHAEMEAVFMFNQENLETIAERLNAFEVEEERIRRQYKNVQYSEMHSGKVGCDFNAKNQDGLNNSVNLAKSVMFTAPLNKEKPPPLPDEMKLPEKPKRNEICIPDAQLNTILLFKQRYENFMEKSIHSSWKYWDLHPQDILEEFSEDILDELLADINNELNDNCNKFVDDIYEKEFLNADMSR